MLFPVYIFNKHIYLNNSVSICKSNARPLLSPNKSLIIHEFKNLLRQYVRCIPKVPFSEMRYFHEIYSRQTFYEKYRYYRQRNIPET